MKKDRKEIFELNKEVFAILLEANKRMTRDEFIFYRAKLRRVTTWCHTPDSDNFSSNEEVVNTIKKTLNEITNKYLCAKTYKIH